MNVGYRYYDLGTAPEPEFHFEFGLSYTKFALSALEICTMEFDALTAIVDLACQVDDTGQAAGKVVIQIYVAPRKSLAGSKPRPVKELEGV